MENICKSCKGTGKIHPSDTLFHEPENCLWCEDCAFCASSVDPAVATNNVEEAKDDLQIDEISTQIENLKQEPAQTLEQSKENENISKDDGKDQVHEMQRPESAASSFATNEGSRPASATPSDSFHSTRPRKSSLFASLIRKSSSSASLLKQNSLRPVDKYYQSLVSSDKSSLVFAVQSLLDTLENRLTQPSTANDINMEVKEEKFDNYLVVLGSAPVSKEKFYGKIEDAMINPDSEYSTEYLLTMYRFETSPATFFQMIKSFYHVSSPYYVPEDSSNFHLKKTQKSQSSLQYPLSPLSPTQQSKMSLGDASSTGVSRKRREQEEKELREYATWMVPFIKTKSLNLLISWMKLYWVDFDKELQEKIGKWAKERLEVDDDYADGLKVEESMRVHKFDTLMSFYEGNTVGVSRQNSLDFNVSNIEGYLLVLKTRIDSVLDNSDLITSLEDFEKRVYSNVKMEDLCKLWTEKPVNLSVSLHRLSRQLQKLKQLRYFFMTVLLVQSGYKPRQTMLKKLFKLAFELFERGLLTSCSCVLSAFLDQRILQQPIMFSGLTPKYFKQLREMIDGMTKEIPSDINKSMANFKEFEFWTVVSSLNDNVTTLTPQFPMLWSLFSFVSNAPRNTKNPLISFIESSLDHQREQESDIMELSEDLGVNLREMINRNQNIVSNEVIITQLCTYVSSSDLLFNNQTAFGQNYAIHSLTGSAASSRPATPQSGAVLDTNKGLREGITIDK